MNSTTTIGTHYLFRGLQLAMRPGLRRFVFIPLTINVAIFTLLIYGSINQFGEWIDWAMDQIPGWLDFLRYLLWPLMVGLLLVVVMYSFSIVANLISSPFNGLLCEKAEELITGQPVTGFETITQAIASFPRSLLREVRKLAYYLPRALLVLIFSFIPLVNTAAPVLWFLLGAWMMAIQYCDYPMDTHRKSFAFMKRSLANTRWPSLGFGATVMIATMIPVVNFFVMPAAVCGATLFWVERLRDETSE